MTAAEAMTLYERLVDAGVRVWVMGGWGVDALLSRQTRAHKDLDLLVYRMDLARYREVTGGAGFARRFEWSESRTIEVGETTYDSAFVDAHPDGRELDVHVVDVAEDGSVVQLHHDPWPLPQDALTGHGIIEGRGVRCVSFAAQLAMHSVYDLSDVHREDVRLLELAAAGRG